MKKSFYLEQAEKHKDQLVESEFRVVKGKIKSVIFRPPKHVHNKRRKLQWDNQPIG